MRTSFAAVPIGLAVTALAAPSQRVIEIPQDEHRDDLVTINICHDRGGRDCESIIFPSKTCWYIGDEWNNKISSITFGRVVCQVFENFDCLDGVGTVVATPDGYGGAVFPFENYDLAGKISALNCYYQPTLSADLPAEYASVLPEL